MTFNISDILIQARDSLTSKNWNKGEYFAAVNGVVCMCGHGAVQALVNPTVSRILASHGGRHGCDLHELVRAASRWLSPRILDVALFGTNCVVEEDADIAMFKTLWETRPEWVKMNTSGQGSLDAHYLLGLVGCTGSFNDDPTTTLGMVKRKFSEAAALAQALEI